MAKTTIIVCDNCGNRIEDEPNVVKMTRKGSRHIVYGDLCGECANSMFQNFPVKPKPGPKPREESNEILVGS